MYEYQTTESAQALLSSVGEALITLRQEAGLTQRQAAKNANSTQARISDLENGKADVQILTLQRWAKVYGYDLELSFIPIEEDEFESNLVTMIQEIEEEGNAEIHEEG